MDSSPDFYRTDPSKCTESLRILHISDAHIRADSDSTDQKKRVAAFVKGLSQDLEREVIHLVAVTGDIASSGLKEEYENFIAWVFKPLCALPALKDARWCLVPGNHDVDFSADFADQRAIKEYGTDSLLEPGSTGIGKRKHLHNRFKNFSALWSDLNALGQKTVCPRDWLEDPGFYVACESLGGVKVRIIGLNTAWCEQRPGAPSKPFPALGARLLEEALVQRCDPHDLTLVIGHHDLNRSGNDTMAFERALSDAQALYLHGHGHEPELLSRGRQDGLVVALMANAIDIGAQNDAPPVLYQKTGYTLISIDAKAQSFLFRPMTLQRGAFMLDSHYDWMTEESGWFRAWRCRPTNNRHLRMGWRPMKATSLPAPTRQEWDTFCALGEPTEAIVSVLPREVVPVEGAVAYLQTAAGTSRIIRLDAPSGEGTSTVFLMIVIAMARVGWRVYVQGDGDPFYQALPEDLRAEKGPILLGIRPPQNEDDADYLKIFIRDCCQFPNIWLLMDGTRWEWGDNLSLLADPQVISWGQEHARAWIGKSIWLPQPERQRHEALCQGKHNDQSIPKKPIWSLFGELIGEYENKAPEAVRARLERHRERMALGGGKSLKGEDVLRVFDIIATVHAAAGAILTRDVLEQACFPGTSGMLTAHLEWLGPEIRTLTVNRRKVFVGRHRAVSAAHASIAGAAPLEAAFTAALTQRRKESSMLFWTDWLAIAPNQRVLTGLERECERWLPEEQIALLTRWKDVSGTAPQPGWHRNLCLDIAASYRDKGDWTNTTVWIIHALGSNPHIELRNSSHELHQLMESVLRILDGIEYSPSPYDLKNAISHIVINIKSHFSNKNQDRLHSAYNFPFFLERLKNIVYV